MVFSVAQMGGFIFTCGGSLRVWRSLEMNIQRSLNSGLLPTPLRYNGGKIGKILEVKLPSCPTCGNNLLAIGWSNRVYIHLKKNNWIGLLVSCI